MFMPKHLEQDAWLLDSAFSIVYETAFAVLKIICKGYKIVINLAFIIPDFESALKNTLKEVIPEAEVKGCYFHFCQCLWRYASTHNLRYIKDQDNKKNYHFLQ